MNDEDRARYLAHFDQLSSTMTNRIWEACRGVRARLAAGQTPTDITIDLGASYMAKADPAELALCAARAIVQLAELTEDVVPNPPGARR